MNFFFRDSLIVKVKRMSSRKVMAIQARRKGAGKKNQKGKKQSDQKKKQKNKKSDDQRKGSISSLPQDNYPESDRQIGFS